MERTLHGKRIGAPRAGARASAPVRPSAPHAPRLALARAAGNQRMVQAKLAIGGVHDPLERAADRAADAVLRAPHPASGAASPPVPVARGAAPAVRRCAECGTSGAPCAKCAAEARKKEDADGVPPVTVRRSPVDGGGVSAAPAGFESRLAGLRGGGEPLQGDVRGFFEPRFGADFSGVRVHTGAEAGEAARSIGARAFTAANDVVFAPGQFAPRTAEGSRLLAHELAHVVQQSDSAGSAVRRAPDVQRQPAPAPRALPEYVADPQGYRGIELFYMAGALPRALYTHMHYEVKRGEYRIVAQLRDPDDSPPRVMYWVAWRRTRRRNEWVIGAADLDRFLADFDHYVAMANLAYAWVAEGAQVPRYQSESAHFVRLGASGNFRAAARQLLRAWGAAASDPGWWAQAVTATAGAVAGGATSPAASVPAAGPPALRVIAGGGGGAGAVPATVARAAPVVTTSPAGAAPVLATRGSLALAPSRAPVSLPFTTPAPAAAAAPRLALVPPAAPAPAPPVPLSPVAAAAAQAATSLAAAGARRAPATAPTPQAARRPSPEPEEQDRRGCRTRQVAMKFGRFPCHADFAFALSGVRREFEVTTPEGLTADFDAIDAGGQLYEVKTGYRWVPFTQNEPNTRRLIGHFQDQAFRQLAVAQRCGRQLVWYFNEPVVAQFFDGILPVTVVPRRFPCTRDSDPLTW